jgi:hypothetical protein
MLELQILTVLVSDEMGNGTLLSLTGYRLIDTG